MPGRSFDSNVLLYLISDDRLRSQQARALLIGGGTISVQVLNEIVNVARRKYDTPWQALGPFLDNLKQTLAVVPVDVATHENACRVAQRYKLAFYDSCIVAAALLAHCDTLWSEDMHDGLVVDGRLTIRNPFA